MFLGIKLAVFGIKHGFFGKNQLFLQSFALATVEYEDTQ